MEKNGMTEQETRTKLEKALEKAEIPEKDQKLGFFQKRGLRKTMEMAKEEIEKMRAEKTPETLTKNRQKTINALIQISKILEVTNENGTEVTKEQWEKMKLTELLDKWEQAIKTLEADIR